MGESLHHRYHWAALPIVFGIKLAGLFEDPTTSIGVIGGFIGGAMNLAGLIQYLV